MTRNEKAILFGAGTGLLLLSGISPYDRATWLTALAYRLIFLHALILMLGGHYTMGYVSGL